MLYINENYIVNYGAYLVQLGVRKEQYCWTDLYTFVLACDLGGFVELEFVSDVIVSTKGCGS